MGSQAKKYCFALTFDNEYEEPRYTLPSIFLIFVETFSNISNNLHASFLSGAFMRIEVTETEATANMEKF